MPRPWRVAAKKADRSSARGSKTSELSRPTRCGSCQSPRGGLNPPAARFWLRIDDAAKNRPPPGGNGLPSREKPGDGPPVAKTGPATSRTETQDLRRRIGTLARYHEARLGR